MAYLKKVVAPFALCALIFSTTPLHAETIEDFYRAFKASKYSEAQKLIEKITFDPNKENTKHYLLGLTHSRLQEFDKAISEFEKAKSLGNDAQDLHYELGQAYYAASDLRKARQSFEKSVELNFNKANSLYYIGHISQTLEEYDKSKNAFTLIIKDKTNEDKIVQIARFQLAETLLSMARDKKNTSTLVDRYVIPLLKQAYQTETTTAVAQEIQVRIQELLNEFKLDPDMMVNGRKISNKRHSLTLGQKLKFDNNVTLANDQTTVLQSKKESYIFETEAYARKDFVFKKRFIISPDARFTFTQYTDSKNSSVYQNNSYLLTTALKSKTEHTLFQRPASFLFDIDRTYTARDKLQEKKRTKYATSLTYTFGEKFKFFNIGDTTIKFKFKDYEAYLNTLNNKTKSLSVDQTWFTSKKHLMIFLFSMDLVDNYNATTNSTNSYLARIDYLIPEIIPQYTLGLALSTTFLDTKEQKSSRGIEKTYSPSVDISRDLSNKLKVGFNYEYTNNSSKSDTYKYTKSVFTTEVKYSF